VHVAFFFYSPPFIISYRHLPPPSRPVFLSVPPRLTSHLLSTPHFGPIRQPADLSLFSLLPPRLSLVISPARVPGGFSLSVPRDPIQTTLSLQVLGVQFFSSSQQDTLFPSAATSPPLWVYVPTPSLSGYFNSGNNSCSPCAPSQLLMVPPFR